MAGLGLESVLVVDQRDIQRRGGVCAKFPVSCLIRDMLKEIGFQLEKLVVLDVTYGEGRFYGAWRPRLLLGSDIRIHRWIVKPDWFTICTSWSVWNRVQKLGIKPDLVVVDPPWFSFTHRGRNYYNYSFGSPEQILIGGLESAAKLGSNHVLVHYNKIVVPRNWSLLRQVEFIYVSRYLKNNQINTNPNKTYFYILKKVIK